MAIYIEYIKEINTKFEEIGGEPLKDCSWYWTSTECNDKNVWKYGDEYNQLYYGEKDDNCRARPVLDLMH
jgi:hypothetical protein